MVRAEARAVRAVDPVAASAEDMGVVTEEATAVDMPPADMSIRHTTRACPFKIGASNGVNEVYGLDANPAGIPAQTVLLAICP